MKLALLLTAATITVAAHAQNAPPPEVAPPAPATAQMTIKLLHVKPSVMAYWLDPKHNPAPPDAPPLMKAKVPFELPGGIQQIVAVDPTNVLLVAGGSDEDIRQLLKLIDVLDQPPSPVESQAQTFTFSMAPHIEAFTLDEAKLKAVLPDFDATAQDGKPRFLSDEQAVILRLAAPIRADLPPLELVAPEPMPNLARGAAPAPAMPNLSETQPMSPLMAPMPGSNAVPKKPTATPHLGINPIFGFGQNPPFAYQATIAPDQSVTLTFGADKTPISVPAGQSATLFLPAQSTDVAGQKRFAFVRVSPVMMSFESVTPGTNPPLRLESVPYVEIVPAPLTR